MPRRLDEIAAANLRGVQGLVQDDRRQREHRTGAAARRQRAALLSHIPEADRHHTRRAPGMAGIARGSSRGTPGGHSQAASSGGSVTCPAASTKSRLRICVAFKDWFKMIGVSENTALALRRAGNAPRFFHISPKRIGTTLGEHREWLASREEVAAVPQVDTRKRRRVAG